MVDFLEIAKRSGKNNSVEIYPKFIVKKSKDLMIKGSDFCAFWIEEQNRWSTSELDLVAYVDHELDKYVEENRTQLEIYSSIRVLYLRDSDNRRIQAWHRFCKQDMRDCFHDLDEEITFENTPTTKESYATKRLPYALKKGDTTAYDHLMSKLYSPEERQKIEWAIGSIVEGDSKHIQKFLVLYGSAGTGKSTVLNIIQQLFEGYYAVFNAKALGSSNATFALESFKDNPLVAIQHDGDLSKIEDNTRLNSLVSHEVMAVNEKFKSEYSTRFRSFLFMGTNKPVKITDAKSGLLRRLIDVTPTGEKLDTADYNKTVKQIKFELGAIAYHCQQVYLENPGRYDSYVPVSMLDASNDIYNFIMEKYDEFLKPTGVSLKKAWDWYSTYCEQANALRLSQRIFKEELKNYFEEYKDRGADEDGTRVRSVFVGFKTNLFDSKILRSEPKKEKRSWLDFAPNASVFDILYADCQAQYAKDDGSPKTYWSQVRTKLKELDTHKLHYVKGFPANHIVIDFDLVDEFGNKSFELNKQAASKFPPTYAELSKSGEGIHLHYIYTGDPSKLSRIYDEHIEIKVFTGDSALRRKLTMCNLLAIATISSGLPLKGDKTLVSQKTLADSKHLLVMIKKCLDKEYGSTTQNIHFINDLLNEASEQGMVYDMTELYRPILDLAKHSTNQRDHCIKMVNSMKLKSEAPAEEVVDGEAPLIFYDLEIFKNLFMCGYMPDTDSEDVFILTNPSPEDLKKLFKYNLVDFNGIHYDRHLMYARAERDYTLLQCYDLSQRIVGGGRDVGFYESKNLGYLDLLDVASTKQSLKKYEIEMGVSHKELGLRWDQPVPEELWPKVAEYCKFDVRATKALYHYPPIQDDILARKMLAALTGLSINDSSNTHSARLIFGDNRHPQREFNYRDLSQPVRWSQDLQDRFGADYIFRVWDENGQPTYETFTNDMNLPDGYSVLPFFPGYEFKNGVSTYQGVVIGEGGCVYAEHGIWCNVDDEDVSSMHPHSAMQEMLFGPRYTKIFAEIVELRVAVKHGDFGKAKTLLEGKVAQLLTDPSVASGVAQALKIVINSVYGLTAAKFDNLFRDPRNKDNIVAKRGALFMTNLRIEVQKRGFKVCHIKTDSIKIPDATPEIIDFVRAYGREYGYSFEQEALFDRMCLVNDAVYVAKYATPLKDKKTGKDIWWTATGTQFQVPYVFKTLFSKEKIEFKDLCETKSVSTAIYLDYNETLPDVSEYEAEKKKLLSKQKKLAKENSVDEQIETRLKELEPIIADGHNYTFVGKVGQFTPVVKGAGGGVLLRQSGDGTKYDAVAGSSDYRWMESELLKDKENSEVIDISYYRKFVDEAVETIIAYGDVEWFLSDSPSPKREYVDGKPVYPDFVDVN